MNDEDEKIEGGFKVGSEDEDEPLDDIPEDLDFGLDEEDPDQDS
jgi:hypothetical protein